MINSLEKRILQYGSLTSLESKEFFFFFSVLDCEMNSWKKHIAFRQ